MTGEEAHASQARLGTLRMKLVALVGQYGAADVELMVDDVLREYRRDRKPAKPAVERGDAVDQVLKKILGGS